MRPLVVLPTYQEAENIEGRKVLTAYARVAPLGWLMFVELPAEEAYAPLYAALKRLGFVLTVKIYKRASDLAEYRCRDG